MGTRSAIPDVWVGRNEPRQHLVGFHPSVPPDRMLDLGGNHHRGVNLEVEEPPLVGNKRGGVAVRLPNPAESGNKRRGGASGDSPPGRLGVGELVSGLAEGSLQVLYGEPPFPHGQRPVSDHRRVGFKRRVEGTTGTVRSKEGEDRVAASSSRGGCHGNFNPGLMQAGVRDAKGLATIHDRRDGGSARHKGGVDTRFPEGFVPVNAATQAGKPVSESDSRSAAPTDRISAK